MNEVLFIVADVMTPTAVSVTSRDTVATAAKLIARHNLAALAVLDGDRFLGLVTPISLLSAPPYRLVGEVMTARGIAPAAPALPLSQAYALMTGQRVEVLPVVDDGRIVGEISATAILRVQGQQNDPLTGLPFSTAARGWAVAALERGHEITILFLDLDNFGAVNKTFGHVVGDNILCTVAHLLSGLVDVQTDLLCRYGGDEFVIATTRREADAHALIRRIQEVVVVPVDAGEGARRVTVSVGIAGGRRAEGRKRAHIAATVEDLLALASRASTAAKAAKRAAESSAISGPSTGGLPPTPMAPLAPETLSKPAQVSEPRLRLVEVAFHTDEQGSTASVILSRGANEAVGRAAGHVHGYGSLFLVAEATLDAIRRLAGTAHTYVVEELREVPFADGKLIVAVLTSTSKERPAFTGSALAGDSPHAVTKAILAALNRHLVKSLSDQP